MAPAQSGPRILSEIFHGECCDECGHQISMEGSCPECEALEALKIGLRDHSENDEEKQELRKELENIYKIGELPTPNEGLNT